MFGTATLGCNMGRTKMYETYEPCPVCKRSICWVYVSVKHVKTENSDDLEKATQTFKTINNYICKGCDHRWTK